MIYLDTSVVVALFTNEKTASDILCWFDGLRHIPVSSDWLIPEFFSAVSMKVQTGQMSQEKAAQTLLAFDVFATTGVRLLALSRDVYSNAAELIRHDLDGLRAGDSLHLAAALNSGATHIATLDRKLARSAARHKLSAISF